MLSFEGLLSYKIDLKMFCGIVCSVHLPLILESPFHLNQWLWLYKQMHSRTAEGSALFTSLCQGENDGPAPGTRTAVNGVICGSTDSPSVHQVHLRLSYLSGTMVPHTENEYFLSEMQLLLKEVEEARVCVSPEQEDVYVYRGPHIARLKSSILILKKYLSYSTSYKLKIK